MVVIIITTIHQLPLFDIGHHQCSSESIMVAVDNNPPFPPTTSYRTGSINDSTDQTLMIILTSIDGRGWEETSHMLSASTQHEIHAVSPPSTHCTSINRDPDKHSFSWGVLLADVP